MPAKIRVLSDHTINQIAAGEVIENPASVVKELVENSIDAGSTEISIEIESGGRQLIRITDNGCGMISDDALLCLERHATSKLQHVDDIHTLTTMGFRGEAIPSIASISKFTLLTYPKENLESSKDSGTLIIVDGGKLISCTKAARNPGTTIEVRSLFFNIPARKKFLKSPSVDANEIYKKVSTIALGYPDLKFQLVNDGKTVFSTTLNQNQNLENQLKNRASDILGDEFIKNCLYVKESSNAITIEGLISLPSYTRHNRTGQYIYINKRAVHSPLISYAVKDGFGTYIDQNRFPVFVLNLNLDGSLVDVNVHPQKTEVRLRQELMIRDLILTAIRKGLSQKHFPSNEQTSSHEISCHFSRSYSLTPNFSQERKPFNELLPWEFEQRSNLETKELETIDIEPKFNASQNLNPSQEFLKPLNSWSSHQNNTFESTNSSKEYSSTSLLEKKPSLKVLATIKGYILIDGDLENLLDHPLKTIKTQGGIIAVNQKNAHARILYEKLSGRSKDPISQQTLLIPHTLELNPQEAELIRPLLPSLNKMGIGIDEFGPTTFMINALPQELDCKDINTFIQEILTDSTNFRLDETLNDQASQEYAKKMAKMASKMTISSTKKLTVEEAEILLRDLFNSETPYICPAGKPTLAEISEEMLAKLFKPLSSFERGLIR